MSIRCGSHRSSGGNIQGVLFFPPLHAASLWGYQRTVRQQRESQRSADNRRKLFGSRFDTLSFFFVCVCVLLFRYATLLSRLVEETCFGPVSEHLRRRSDGISGSFRKLGFMFPCPLPVKHTPEKKEDPRGELPKSPQLVSERNTSQIFKFLSLC